MTYACGYCGSDLELYGEVVHAPECSAPDPYGDEDEPMTDVQKMFVLLAEIRQCINDDQLMAAQRKVMAIEAILKSTGRPTGSPEADVVDGKS